MEKMQPMPKKMEREVLISRKNWHFLFVVNRIKVAIKNLLLKVPIKRNKFFSLFVPWIGV